MIGDRVKSLLGSSAPTDTESNSNYLIFIWRGKWIMANLRNRIIDFIYKKATLQGKHHGRLTFLAGALFFCAVLFIIFLALLSDKLLNLHVWPPSPVNLVLSIPLLALGIWLWLWSALIFFQSRGTPVPLSPPPKLVETGPYVYSRNPMLSGLFLILFGIGFLFQSLTLIIIYTPLFIVITFLEFKIIEEPELEKRFGASYIEYKKKVPMFFPYPGRVKH
jgi:protein-S-isoprenylcysteine O-methyltransferase Ste14